MLYSVFLKCINMAVLLVKSLMGLEATKMVIIVRTDLKMGCGKVASQVAHAAVSLYQTSIENSNPHLEWWMQIGQPKIVLKINSDCDTKLQSIVSKAKELKLNVCIIRDAGRTQVGTGTVTAVGIGPNKENEIDTLTGDLKLL